MVAMESKAQTQKAVKKLKVYYCIVFIFSFFMIIFQTKSLSKIGLSLRLMDDMMAEEEDDSEAATNGVDKER